MRIVDLFAGLILPPALWGLWRNWRRPDPRPVCTAPTAETCPHCGQLHPPGPVYIIGGDGSSIEDYYLIEITAD